ncbi:MAG TPA: hypothetical protein VFQ30_09445 [Ktedonobacteraceae bacterium]|nr:hypothetical protein [Ktedonobacteraceae bacterium]
MKETLPVSPAEPVASQDAKPQGIGMAVAFDWGLAVELFLLPLFPSFSQMLASMKQFHLSSGTAMLVAILLLWPIAICFALLGEAVRSGRNWARRIQIVFNALGFLGGITLAINVVQTVRTGDYLSIVPAFILFVISPLIAWRLSRPVTARWFKTVSSTNARRRHSGLWLVFIALWSIIGGVLVALGAVMH